MARASTPLRRVLVAAACVAVSFLPGMVGSRFRPGAWYAGLAKPALTPPGWVFPIAWTTLYALMGLALWRFLEHARAGVRAPGLALFGAQLVCNGLWSYLFFGLERPGLALIDVAALWGLILATLIVFARADGWAGLLLVPYLAWVTFASYLNLAIWWLQR